MAWLKLRSRVWYIRFWVGSHQFSFSTGLREKDQAVARLKAFRTAEWTFKKTIADLMDRKIRRNGLLSSPKRHAEEI